MSFEITPREIDNLEPPEFVDFVNHLIQAEADRVGISPTHVKSTSYTTARDGGVDGRVEDEPPKAASRWLPPGSSIFQFKTDRAGKNATPTKLSREANKPGVREALADGARYLVAVGHVFDSRMRKSREAALRDSLRALGHDPERVTLLTADDLARWASEHPALLLLPCFRRPVGKCMRVEQWQLDRRHVGEFIPDSRRTEIIGRLREFAGGAGSPVHLRVEGRQGIGKTRVALEATRESGVRERTLYASEPADVPPELWAWMRDKTATSLILVIDECDEGEAQKLKAQADACEGRVRLATVGAGEPFPFDVSPTRMYLDRLDDESIRRLLRGRLPSLTHDQITWISRLTAGYVRLAVACGEAVSHKPEIDLAQLIQTPEVRHLLEILLPDPTARKVMQGLSLLSRVGVEGEIAEEGQQLAAFMGVSWQDLATLTEQMFQKGLVGKKGRYRYVTPDLLASWLAAEVWQVRADDVRALASRLPLSSQDAFWDRLKDLGAHDKAREVINHLLSEEGFFRTLDHLDSEEGAKVLYRLALGNPEGALRALKRLLGDCDVPRLRTFEVGRRWVVWTLDYLKWFKSTFHGAGRLLLALAEEENETWANNATGLWKKMFQVYLGGTEVPPGDRVLLIEEALASDSPAKRKLAIQALHSMLLPHEARSSGSEERGSQPVPPEWHPRTWNDIWEVKRLALTLLDRAVRDSDPVVAKEAQAVLLGAMRHLVLVGLADEILGRLETFDPQAENERHLARNNVGQVLQFEKERLKEDQLKRFIALEERLTGTSFRDRLHRWVGRWAFGDWNIHKRDAGPPPQERAAALAEEAVNAPDLLRSELDWLVSPEAERSPYFGGRLGEVDKDHVWFAELLAKAREGQGVPLLASYLAGQVRRGATVWVEEHLDAWGENEPGLAAVVLEATFGLEPTMSAVGRVIRLAEKGWIERKQLGNLMCGGWAPRLPLVAFQELLQSMIADQDPKCYEAAMNGLEMRLDSQPDEKEGLSPLAWQLIEKADVTEDATTQHYWGELVQHYIADDPVRVATAVLNLYGKSTALFLAGHPPMEMLAAAARLRPQEVWEHVADVLLSKDDRSYRLRSNLELWFIDLIDADFLLAWAEEHKPAGPKILAALTVPAGHPLSRLPRELLICFGDDSLVINALESNLRQGTFSGSMTAWLESKLEMARGWSNDPEPHVRRWAQGVVDRLEADIKQTKPHEEEWGLS